MHFQEDLLPFQVHYSAKASSLSFSATYSYTYVTDVYLICCPGVCQVSQNNQVSLHLPLLRGIASLLQALNLLAFCVCKQYF